MNSPYERTLHFARVNEDVTVVETPGENEGSQKKVALDKEGRYAVAIYTTVLGHAAKHADIDKLRLSHLLDSLQSQKVQDCWKQMICFPRDWIFDRQGRLAVLLPRIPASFSGTFLGESYTNATAWLESPFYANALFAESPESGDLFRHLLACRRLAAAVGRIHKFGWVHTDLSANNVLIDPIRGVPYVIDLDGSTKDNSQMTLLRNKTIGTSGFIAPEIFKAVVDGAKVLFSISADLHPLAIHIYALLLHRHPFWGVDRALEKKWGEKYENVSTDDLYLSLDPQYIEAPNDSSRRHIDHIVNRYGPHYWHVVEKKPAYQKLFEKMPEWTDVMRLSARKVCGPCLATLFDKAFVDGLAQPAKRPSAKEWQEAITKTINLLQVCPKCFHGGVSHFVYEGEGAAICPFCGYRAPPSPFLTFHYFSRSRGEYLGGKSYLTCHDERYVFLHQLEGGSPDEGVRPTVVGRIRHADGRWLFVNLALKNMRRFTGASTFDDAPAIPQNGEAVLEEDALFHLGGKGDLDLVMSCNFSK